MQKYINSIKPVKPNSVFSDWKYGNRNNILNEMAYPSAFDMKEFKAIRTFVGRVNYCNSRLKYLGRGSSRMVYEIDDEKVLKLAYNSKGVAQNQAEADWMLERYGIFAEVYDMHPDYLWIEMEKAIPAKKSDFDRIYGGLSGKFNNFFIEWKYDIDKDFTKGGIFEWLADYIIYLFCNINGSRHAGAWDEAYSNFETIDEYEGSLFQGLRDYIYDWDLHAIGDLRRISSYGIVKRDGHDEIVLIDYGLNNNVYDRYYSRRRK